MSGYLSFSVVDNSSAKALRGRGDADRPPHNGWAGEWTAPEWSSIAFYPQWLEKILSEKGWEAEAIIGAWYDRGWLDHDKDRRQKLMRSRSSGERVRFYSLNRSAIEEELGILDETEED